MTESKLQTPGLDPERLARLGARIDADIESEKYDGAAVRVRRGGENVYDGAHGYADRDAGRALTTCSPHFRSASKTRMCAC